MRLPVIAVLCALVLVAAGDVAHLKAKARRLAAKHHKRGVLSAVPPFKLGHDIPHVTHSVVKPFVVTYPPTASVTAVKVPLTNPLVHRYPVPVGHKVPVPHPHYGLKFPHRHKTFVRPDQHFHHHHHHVAPRPIVPVIPTAPVPVPATPLVPVAQPSVVHQVPAPSPPVFVQPVPAPVAPPPVQFLPPHHGHLTPLLPAAHIPIQPAPLVPSPVFPVAPQYVIRPGNAIQTSLFATYPRYPLVNFQQYYPLTAPAAPAPTVGQVFLERPQVPHFHFGGHGVVQQPTPAVALESTPTLLHPTQTVPHVHLQPTQPVPLDHDGWAPVPAQPHDLSPTHTHTEAHFPHQAEGQFTQEQGTQVFEHHTGEQQYHGLHQLQNHIQQHIDQAQYEQHLHNQHQLNQEYGAPQLSQEYGHPNQDVSQHEQEYAQHGQEYAQHGQEYAQSGQEYSQQGHEYAQHGQEYAQHGQEYAQHGHEYAQQAQEYALQQQQIGQEYGPPQQVEGRSIEAEDTQQRYHNHIPLGLQPPINRPLEHFR